MNKNILKALLATTVGMTLAGCGENSWNDHYLDGFEGGVVYDKTISGTYTVTEADYATIASKMRALATTKADSTAANAIRSNLYFEKFGLCPATKALPVFMDDSDFPYYHAPNGSTVDLTYREAAEVPEELSKIAGAATYTVTKDDYISVWGSDENYIPAFAPVATAAANIPSILKAAMPAAVSGDYSVVTYAEASVNPVFTTDEQAPRVYIDETFNEDMGDFTLDDIIIPEGSTYIWKHDVYNNEGYMKASGFVNRGCRLSEGWLLSPEVTVAEGGGLTLSFEQAWKNFKTLDNAKDEATVWVKENGGEWTQLTPSSLPENTSYDFYPTGDIDLSAYTGKTIRIGFLYKSTTESAGTWELRNVVLQTAAASNSPSRSLAAEVPAVSKNAVYYFNGRDWSVATGAAALNPDDYTAMGFTNNRLSDPDIFIPLWLKGHLPYAQSGDQEFVVYNGSRVDLFVFDGSAWTLNNNGLETVTGRFEKKNGVWSFLKYIGKAIFDEFKEDQIMLDRSYLLVSGTKAATAIDKNNSYGYLPSIDITVTDEQIILRSDESAYTFASSYTDEDTQTKTNLPEGKFLLRDTYGRYLYLQGTYNSCNLKKVPDMTDDAINENFLWTASRNDDGTWSIVNSSNGKTWYYSVSYSNFAAYDAERKTDTDVTPALYILSE